MEAGVVEQNYRILLLAEDAWTARKTAAPLTAAGWQVTQAGDLIQAFSVLKFHDVDLIVLRLPPEEFVQSDLPGVLRKVAAGPSLPVVALTGAGNARRSRGLEGCDEILPADAPGAELVSRLGVLLRLKRLQDQLADSQSALTASLEREQALERKLRRDHEDMQTLAGTDPLTRARNVRAFRAVLDHEFQMSRRYDHPLSLLMVDVDHFKLVNDCHGHPTGDYVLKELTVILKQSVRESDVVCRTGGEEFSIILPRAELAQTETLACRITQNVRDRVFCAYGQRLGITISVGWATYPRDPEIVEADMLVYFADQALLHAKQTGRDRVVGFHDLAASTRLELCRQYADLPAVVAE
jgi:two-component system, cell cycle response regulator